LPDHLPRVEIVIEPEERVADLRAFTRRDDPER
jgi:hypothetical protein